MFANQHGLGFGEKGHGMLYACAGISVPVRSSGNGPVEPFCLPRVRNLNLRHVQQCGVTIWAASQQRQRTMGNYSAWATVGGQPGRSTQIVRKDVDMKRQLTSRLETRTKESNMHVSIMVENQ